MFHRATCTLYLLTVVASPATADDGHLNALGTANVVTALLPIVGFSSLVFILSAMARFGGNNGAASVVMRISGGLIGFICGGFVLLLQPPAGISMVIVSMLLVIALAFWGDYRLRKRGAKDEA